MRLKIECDTGAVSVNGTSYIVNCESIPREISAVNWYDDHGVVDYRDGRPSHGLADVSRFKQVIDNWHEKHTAMRTR